MFSRFVWLVLVLLFLASFFNYFDRQTLSVLKTTLKHELHIDDAGYALLVNIFTGCYALAYMFSGWIVDKLGSRKSLTIFISLWSIVTAGCGFAHKFWHFAFFRGMMGLVEPGLHPVTIRAATMWVADRNRGLFMALAALGSTAATVISVPIIAWLTTTFHWRLSFILPGFLGIGVAVLWWFCYREPKVIEQDETTALNEGRNVEPPLTVLQLIRNRNLWGILLSRMLGDPVLYFCVFWMPGYLQESKGISLTELGQFGWIPFFSGTVGGLVFTAMSDKAASMRGFDGRRFLATIAALFGPIAILIPGSNSIALTILLFCMVNIIYNCWMGSLAPIISEIFPVGNVGTIWGLAGAFGATGAIIFNLVIGHAANLLGAGTLFIIMGCLHPSAAIVLNTMVRPKHKHA